MRTIQDQKETLFLREMGYILLLGATIHFAAVTQLYLSHGFPTHDRLGYIFFIGLVQVATGLLDLFGYKLLMVDRSLARRAVLISTLIITGYVLVILPAFPDFSFLFKLAPPAYLLYHWWALLNLRVGNGPAL